MRKTKKPIRKLHKARPEPAPFRHIERMIREVDRDNDDLQRKVLLLSILSVLMTFVGLMLAITHFS